MKQGEDAPCAAAALQTLVYFLTLDNAGARTSGDAYDSTRIDTLVINPFPGALDYARVTGSFSLGCLGASPDSALVKVHWNVFGEVSDGGFSYQERIDSTAVVLKRKGQDWKLARDGFDLHISPRVALHYRRRLSAADRARLEQLVGKRR